MILQGTALMPGSCGELVQGTLQGVNFLVTCPVNWFSRVTVHIGPSLKDAYPAGRSKTARAVRKLLDWCGCEDFGAVIEVASTIPVGKGMASSTADLAAGCYAVAAALGIRPDPALIARIALSIEPSDGTFLPGIALFDHVRGRLREGLGNPLSLGILVLDFGGRVDTLEFNRRPDLRDLNRENEPQVERALDLVRQGLLQGDPVLLGQGATMSALAHQRILPKPRLEELIDFTGRLGAYGVNVAHSGTVTGVLVAPGMERDCGFTCRILERFPEVKACYPLRLVGGGPRFPGKISGRRGGECRAEASTRG